MREFLTTKQTQGHKVVLFCGWYESISTLLSMDLTKAVIHNDEILIV